MDSYYLVYDRFNIVQPLDLLEQIETLPIRRKNTTIFSLSMVNMYPSTRCSLIKKAVEIFTRQTSDEDKSRIKMCLDMIHFSMKTTYLSFQHRCYFKTGAGEPSDVALAIGGHGSAFLADMSVAYIFEQYSDCFEHTLFPFLIYNTWPLEHKKIRL